MANPNIVSVSSILGTTYVAALTTTLTTTLVTAASDKLLKLNSYAAETTSADNDNIEFLSNGFKIREDNAGMNAINGVYVFAAWAEHPHKTARAL